MKLLIKLSCMLRNTNPVLNQIDYFDLSSMSLSNFILFLNICVYLHAKGCMEIAISEVYLCILQGVPE